MSSKTHEESGYCMSMWNLLTILCTTTTHVFHILKDAGLLEKVTV